MSDLPTTVELSPFQWKPEEGLWASGHLCYVGKWPIGKACYVSRSKKDEDNYGAFMRLPGLKECVGYYRTEELARARVETVATYWFSRLGPIVPSDPKPTSAIKRVHLD